MSTATSAAQQTALELSDERRWLLANDEYLSKAVAWLRLLLGRQSEETETSPEEAGAGLFGRKKDPPAAPRRIGRRDVAAAAEAVTRAAEAVEPPPAVELLGRRLGLSRFEREVLLLCTAVELDTRIAPLCARALGDPVRPYPTFALALALFDEPSWDVLSPERPLRYWRLLEINQPAAQPLTTSPLRADERIVNYAKGLNYLDDRLSPLLAPVDELAEAGREPPPPSQRAVVDQLKRHLVNGRGATGGPALVQLLGPDPSSQRLVAARAATELGLELLRLPAALLPADGGELETLARLWQRESLLLPLVLYVDATGLDDAGAENQTLQRFLARVSGRVFLATRDLRPGLERTSLVADVERPTAVEQRRIWEEAVGELAPASPASLAGQFNLGAAQVRRIAAAVLNGGAGEPPAEVLHGLLWDACLTHTRPRLDVLAERIDARATWNDIVLPPRERDLLEQVADQVAARVKVYDDWGFRERMNRGLGITALFAGPSGTGKTMAAEVVANHLRLNLYRIDLSAVVSKYIGETEKNLRRLFDAAEDGGAILFFDEADALFGKRSEVKDSHDRYANIEINYLLQRMEAYRGLAILATNMKSALDTAFVRRLRFILDFPFPSKADRREIWQKAFPPDVPKGELDWKRLARLDLTGGSIHNIALNAAFRAAHDDVEVSMPVVLAMARDEFRKLERPVDEAEFRWREEVAS